uniref:E3 ubiquitin-protein ligase APD1-4 middle domain-containing protein n=1 Tax=Cacopsylla melanoneura TaxID=428564 RepID=A0A8D9AT85_9HEMI
MAEQPVAYYHGCNYNSLTQLQRSDKMHGARRVIVFCCLTAILPTAILIIPLYLRHKVYMDIRVPVAESDILEVKEGVSSIFCEAHTLSMNSTFSAFQVQGTPKYSQKRKHVRLMKSMTLPDDTLEYWGFYLPQGSTVNLSVCSRYFGASILVVKGEKQLRSCGLLDHHKKQSQNENPHNEVKVTFETEAEVINHNNPLEEEEKDNHGGEVNEIENEVEMLKKSASKIIDQKANRKTRRDVIQDRIDMIHGNVQEQDSDTSSFEAALKLCYKGDILLSNQFNESEHCTDVHFLAKVSHMSVEHEVLKDGYYYYIFYSDNDLVSNDLHAVFNIYKPTLLHSNISGSGPNKACINQTQCGFTLDFFNSDSKKVIVEVPTRDGIEHEPDDVTILLSSCKPRISVYLIFPFLVLVCIMCCAFI